MARRFYRALIHKDGESDYGVTFPEFPGCITTGETLQEAASNAVEALSLHIEGMLEAGEPVPEPVELNAPLPDWEERDGETVSAMIPAETSSRTVRTNITLDEALLARLDAAAAAEGMSRSGYIAEAVRTRLRDVKAA